MTLYDLKVAINSIPVTIDDSSIITFERDVNGCEFEYGEVDLYFIPWEFELELEVRLR